MCIFVGGAELLRSLLLVVARPGMLIVDVDRELIVNFSCGYGYIAMGVAMVQWKGVAQAN